MTMMTHYHVSAKDLGEVVTLKAAVPSTAGMGECKNTLRVCFAPTIWQCLLSISSTASTIDAIFSILNEKNKSNPAVYYTNNKLQLPKNHRKSDYKETGEKWSLKDIEVKRLGYIDMRILVSTGHLVITKKATNNLTKNEKNIIRNFALMHDNWSIINANRKHSIEK